MRIILRRRIRPNPASNQAEYRQVLLKARRLTIGRAADRHVQIDHADVSSQHAIVCSVLGRLRVRAAGAGTVIVNGKRCRNAWLRTGDVMTFGVARLSVEQQRADGVVVLRLNDPHALSTKKAGAADDLSLKAAGINPRYWSWLLVTGVLCIGFLSPFAGAIISPFRAALRAAPLVPSDTLWLPGPLHDRHRALGDDCNVCHTKPFEHVANAACVKCHREVQNHVAVGSPEADLFAGSRCADCHLEHDAQKSLVDDSSVGCVACHADLKSSKPDTQLGNVGDFSRTHPDFELSVLSPVKSNDEVTWRPVAVPAARRDAARQDSNLIFSHKVHLDSNGIDSPKGRQKLSCNDCHQADAAGRFMLPIRMQTHCAECHTLQFDEADPGATVPHGDLPRMFKALEEHFSRLFLDPAIGRAVPSKGAPRRPGSEQQILTQDEQRRALAWADRQSMAVARELLEKRVCVECHRITRDPLRAEGPEHWRVEPVRLTERWFPRARFSHAAHGTSACSTCHHAVERDDDSANIQMPGISVCRDCHGDNDRRKVASTCIMCHDFHHAGRGPLSEGRPVTTEEAAR
jgi:FHA domain-containing protein